LNCIELTSYFAFRMACLYNPLLIYLTMPVDATKHRNASNDRGQRGRKLYDEIKASIMGGIYAPGSRLLSTRACAAERGLSRSTVSLVYEQLASEGFIETIAGASSRVAIGMRGRDSLKVRQQRTTKTPDSKHHRVWLSSFGDRIAALLPNEIAQPSSGCIDFAYGPVSGKDFPTMAWRKAARQVELERPDRVAYEDPRGDLSFRQALRAHLARARGLNCEIEQIIVVNGSQQAIDLCARLLLNPEDSVAVENPGYRMAHQAFEAMGAHLRGIDVDAHGMMTDQLAQASERLAYVTPTHQYPLGGLLTVARRRQLLAWAHSNQAWIIEDDYDSEYRYTIRPEPTLKSMDENERVIYVGTFSKTLSPQLRLGYMIVPHDLASLFAAAKQLVDRHSAVSPQRTLALLLENGIYDRHVRRIRRIQHNKCTALMAALNRHLGQSVSVQGAAGGLHVVVWVHAVPHRAEQALIKRALKEGVMVYPIDAMYLRTQKTSKTPRCAGLVMGYATLDDKQIDLGIRRLNSAILSVGSLLKS
jgi:GntR family transcriptional regulator / MocR family aminotransferase